jgi:hypothetical protein
MVGLMIAVHAWASPETKVFGVMAVVFMGLVTVLTCSVHFVILTVSHRDEFAGQAWLPSVLSFRWLSITYALDILAWDVFFALAVLSAAGIFRGNRLARSIRLLMIISGVLALAGLSGVILDDARARNIGIAGYAGVFPVAAFLLAILFYRATPGETQIPGPRKVQSGPNRQQPRRGPTLHFRRQESSAAPLTRNPSLLGSLPCRSPLR